MKIRKKLLFAIMNHSLLLIFASLVFVPLVWAFKSAFTPNGEIFTTNLFELPSKLSFNNLISGLTYAPFDKYFVNSLVVALFVSVSIIITSTTAGYGFAKFNFRGRQILFSLVIAGMLLPFQAILIPLFIEIRFFGWIDQLQGIAVPGAVSAFGIFMMRQFIISIPNELIEASMIDGCGSFGVFARIITPLAKGPISALGALAFLASWNNYLWPLIVVQNESRMTIPLGLSLFRGNNATAYGEVFAVSLVAAIPVAILFMLMRRQIVSSFATSGIK
jgi:multiple sugar transport system permease protein